MPPTTTYPQSYDTSPQTPDRIAQTHRINGARIASPALDRRHRPAFLPAFSGLEASRLYEGKRKLSDRHRASRRAEHSPTITVEQDPNPPPVYTPTLPLHASIVPLPSVSAGRSGGRTTNARTRTSDSIIFVFIAIFVVAFLAAVFLIFKIRRNRRKREESRIIPVKNGPPSPHKVRPWMVAANGTPLKKSSSEGSTINQEKCLQNAPPPHDLATSPFVVSSGSLDSSSYTASSNSSSGHLDGFFSSSCMTITEKVDSQKRDLEDKGVPYALSYVESGSDVSDGSDRDSVKTMIIDPVEPLILDATTNYVCPDPSLDGPTYGLETSYDSETANEETCTSVDFYRLETAHSRCMETVQAVLVRCPAAATPEVTTDPISAQSEVALPSLLLTSPPK
ncbi:hypothetical protein ONZ45_g18813 [Pleurotus djamor]|nr:hypothetical protein ONZ45_g18813 [Pleurotus djamor]